MRSVLWWVGVTVGALALAALVVHGFGVHLVGLPGVVVDTYDFFSQAVFGKLELWIERHLTPLRDWAGRDLLLYPHWKNVFLVMWLYFLADIRSAVEQRRPAVAVMLFVWGTIVALVAGIGAGTVPLDANASTRAQLTLLAFPVAGLTVHQIAWCLLEAVASRASDESIGGRFAMFLREEVLPIALGGALALVLCAYAQSIPLLAQTPEAGLALFLTVFTALALFHFWRGGVYAALDRMADEGWWNAVRRTGSARLAFFMLTMLAGAALIFVTDAALKIIGS